MGDTLESFPLFPLGLVLLPHERIPLHIFEDRYRLDDRRVPRRRDASSGSSGSPTTGLKDDRLRRPHRPVLERFDDGRLNILVEGTTPFRLLRRIEDLPYPAGDVELLERRGRRRSEAADAARSALRRPGRARDRRAARAPSRSASSTPTGWPPRSTWRRTPSRRCWSSARSATASSGSRSSSPPRSSGSSSWRRRPSARRGNGSMRS